MPKSSPPMLIEDPTVINFQRKFIPPTLIPHPTAIRDSRSLRWFCL